MRAAPSALSTSHKGWLPTPITTSGKTRTTRSGPGRICRAVRADTRNRRPPPRPVAQSSQCFFRRMTCETESKIRASSAHLERASNDVSLTSSARLCFPRLTITGWLGQGDDNKRFTGHGADVVMKTHNLDSGDLLDHPLYERLRIFDQVRSYLLEQIPPLLGREFGKLLLGGRQQTLEPDDNEIAEKVGVNVLGASASVFLLKATDP